VFADGSVHGVRYELAQDVAANLTLEPSTDYGTRRMPPAKSRDAGSFRVTFADSIVRVAYLLRFNLDLDFLARWRNVY
jgi:hypothetical protein